MTPPDAAYVAALAALPAVGPARLTALLARGTPPQVFADVVDGRLLGDEGLVRACGRADVASLFAAWRAAAALIDVTALYDAHRSAGVDVLTADRDGWPSAFDDDPDPPAVLFTRGDRALLDPGRPRVAVVGTRRCTRYGWNVGYQLGRDLTEAGVSIVSGLARGIDAAAHRGAIDALDATGTAPTAGPAAPIGIVGSGLDVVYPRDARPLWERVGSDGVLVSEAPLGTRPARWRFPARNRLIAAIADAVVVVESSATGGALHTVDEALARDRPVLAVPGPITSAASVGTNRLLGDSALPVGETADVLAVLGLPARTRSEGGCALPADPTQAAVLEALGWTEATLDAVAARVDIPLGAVAAALGALERAGLVVPAGPTSWLRVAAPLGVTR